MITRVLLMICLVLFLPLAGAAQDMTAEDTEAWEQVATSAENLAAREDVSNFAMSRLRAELVIWRDRFLARSTMNAGRIATVDMQLAALGPVPENGEETPEVAARRAALIAQRQDLVAPRLLAQEAHARANGLIGEFDAFALQRQTQSLTERGPSPLNPTYISPALIALWEVVKVVTVEVNVGFSVQMEQGTLLPKLPRATLFFVVAIALLGFGRRRVTSLRTRISQEKHRLLPLSLFLLSIVQIAVPVLGIYALKEGLSTLDVFGLRSGDVANVLPGAGLVVVFSWWLSRHIFPVGTMSGGLGYDEETRAAGRRDGLSIAWVLAIASLFYAALRTMDVSAGVVSAINLPVVALLGFLLWHLGRAIKTKPEPVEGATVSPGRVRGIIGQLCILVAFAAPALVAVGYDAGRSLMVSWLVTLGVIGVVLIIQRLVVDLSLPEDGSEEPKIGARALAPVLINLALYLISLPILALIWGARADDLFEIWAKFREGFAIGESRISPTDFLTFALVFGIGYLLTRTIQGTLRKTVLPRTRLDLGGQNAVIAGFGYIGIILAAIIAITSAGIDLSNLAIVAGALSVGIGFGLQNIVSNFVSGIILLIERPVSEGDWIEVGGQMGYVRAISVRSTRIETFDRTDVIVPNADLVSGQVTNWTRGNLIGRVIVPVGVAYGTDPERVTNILREIAEAHPLVIMTPPPNVLFIGFGADSLDFEIRAILRDVNYVLVTKSEINHEIAKRFTQEGIEIPFAQRDIWLRNPEVLNRGKE